MDQNSNYITIEINTKISCKDYRFVLGVKRVWIIAIIVAVIKILVWALRGNP